MTHSTVVVVGTLPVEYLALDLLVAEFGWSLKEVGSLRCLAELNLHHNLVSVLFSPRNLGLPWDEAVRSIKEAAPKALPILCHGFAETIDWPQVAEAGAFHSLLLPFSVPEVRQSLGFVWGAKSRSVPIPIRDRPCQRTVIREQGLARAAGTVA
jgi:hypothetical protein